VAATFGSMSCNLSGQMTATGHFSLRPLYCMTPRFDLELPCLLFFGERRRQLGQGLSDSPTFTRTAVVFFAPWSKVPHGGFLKDLVLHNYGVPMVVG
jgi:hypothetical protein